MDHGESSKSKENAKKATSESSQRGNKWKAENKGKKNGHYTNEAELIDLLNKRLEASDRRLEKKGWQLLRRGQKRGCPCSQCHQQGHNQRTCSAMDYGQSSKSKENAKNATSESSQRGNKGKAENKDKKNGHYTNEAELIDLLNKRLEASNRRLEKKGWQLLRRGQKRG